MITNDTDRKLLRIVGIILSIFGAIVFFQTLDAEENFVNPFVGLVSFCLFWVGLWIIFREN